MKLTSAEEVALAWNQQDPGEELDPESWIELCAKDLVPQIRQIQAHVLRFSAHVISKNTTPDGSVQSKLLDLANQLDPKPEGKE